ncbi:S9 family peptidase [Litorimonas sp. WD9-15]|uniref:S9 family peptidase n=1 Tax=Litorimonas sp. WD9-15 TaxID=3418716 RepID=UPI003D07E8CC
MRFQMMLGGALMALTACGEVEGPEARLEAELSELTYETPKFSEANRESPVAAYVMANGATRAQIAPDGTFIALSSSKSGEAQLYVGAPDGADLQQVTDGAGISFFDILPGGDILYGADNNGDERENYFLYDAETGTSDLILPATEKGFRSYGGASGNGKTIAFASTERNGSDFDIYLMNLESGEVSRVFEGVYGNFVEAVNYLGTELIVSETVGEDSDKIFLLDVESGERHLLSDPTPRANHTNAGIHFLEKSHILLATNMTDEFSSLFTLQASPNYPTIPRKLFSVDGSDIDAVESCGRNLVSINRDGFSELAVLGSGGIEQVNPVNGLPRGVYSIDCSRNKAVIRVTGPDIPGDVYMLDLKNPEPKLIYSSEYGALDKNSLITPISIRMTARDGLEVQGLLYMPSDSSNTKPPVVFMVHGGPTAQARPSYNPTVQYLVSRGIAVFQTNVRGSTGFGRTYTTLDDRRKRLDSIRDLVDMLGSPELMVRVDTDRAAVMGGSYGGYAVNAVLSEYPDAFVAGVSLFGVADWVTALEVASPALKAADLIEYGNIEEQEWRDFYTEQSPIRNADKIKVPVLFSHGAMDPRIDIAETETMVRALRANGIDAPYIRFPDEGHGWRKVDNQLYYQRRQAEFLEEVLGVE